MKYIAFFIIIFVSKITIASPSYLSLGQVYHIDRNINNFTISKAVYKGNLQQLSDKGDANASYELGLVALQDNQFKKAFNYFKKSCDGNNAKACNNAGFIKHHNLEKNKNNNFSEAEQFYIKGRDLGDSYAFYNLARFYFKKKNYMMSFLHYELAHSRFKKKTTQQIILNNKAKSAKRLNSMQKKYLNTYYPQELSQFASGKIINNRDIAGALPLPPINTDIKENPNLLNYKSKDNKDKKAIMLDWKPIKSDFVSLPVAVVTEDISSPKAMDSLTYRYDIPATLKITLSEKTTVLPAIVGDDILVYIYSGNVPLQPIAWEVSPTFKSSSIVITPPQISEKGWEIFNVSCKFKGSTTIEFVNKETDEKLSLRLYVQ